jgi:hypothetical protein
MMQWETLQAKLASSEEDGKERLAELEDLKAELFEAQMQLQTESQKRDTWEQTKLCIEREGQEAVAEIEKLKEEHISMATGLEEVATMRQEMEELRKAHAAEQALWENAALARKKAEVIRSFFSQFASALPSCWCILSRSVSASKQLCRRAALLLCCCSCIPCVRFLV